MISRVLVPMDDSEMAVSALEYALEAHPDAEITVLHIVGEPSSMMGGAVSLALEDDIEEAAEERASAVLARAREIAQTSNWRRMSRGGIQRRRLSSGRRSSMWS